MPATPPRQPSLFDDVPEVNTAAARAAVLRVPGATAKLTKAQKEFNRLNERLGRLRTHLADWNAAVDALRQRHAGELEPLQRKLRLGQRELVLWIDAHLQRPPAGEKTPKKARAKLVALLRLLAQAVLDDGPDAPVEAAHDRHSPQSLQQQRRDQSDLAAAILGQVTGDESLFEGRADSVEELLARATERLQQQADDAPDAEPPPGHRPTRAEKARARDAKALKEASRSVREIYRSLASSLHPDRETEAAERTRKTALMARANQAYEAGDLLALLALQLELEHIDADHLAGLSDARLAHYNRVLKEQQASLEDELALLQMPVAEANDLPPGLLGWPPLMLTRLFEQDVQTTRTALKMMAEDAALLTDARTRARFLRDVDVPDPDADDLDEAMFALALQDIQVTTPPRPGKKRRRR